MMRFCYIYPLPICSFMFSRKMQIAIVLVAIIVVAIIAPSKIGDMIELGGSKADDIVLNLIGVAASLFTLMAAIDIKKDLNTHTDDKALKDTKQLDTVAKPGNGNSYCQLNMEVKQVLGNLPKFLVGHIIVTILLLTTIVVLFIVYFKDIAYYFYGVTKDANGQLLTALLTAIGGGAVIYGLWLNNKRIKEQIRQNDIAKTQADIVVSNNNDKRFGEAISFLGSDSEGIAIGGAYILYQLAKEDSRYVSVIAKILVEKLSSLQSIENDSRKLYNVLIELILSDVFHSEKMNLEKISIRNLKFDGIQNKNFSHCSFTNIYCGEICNCNLISCQIDSMLIRGLIFSLEIKHSFIINFPQVDIGYNYLKDMNEFCHSYRSGIKYFSVQDSIIQNFKLCTLVPTEYFTLKNNTISNFELRVASSAKNDIEFGEKDVNVLVVTDNQDGIKVKGENKNVIIQKHKEYYAHLPKASLNDAP